MNIGLGIDTGGTFTDAVIYDYEKRQVLCSSKTLTTREDLARCILAAIQALDETFFSDIRLVALSTTLATNACVEGRGSPARLVIIGGDKKIVASRHAEFGLPPAGEILYVEGRISLDGTIVEEPDWGQVRSMLSEAALTDRSFAVAGMLASRNPALEYRVRDILCELGCEAVCSCDLAVNELNYLRRASSALLNARLTPLISEFIASVKLSLSRLRVEAPVYIVRSDGSLMSADFAVLRPVETLLCGPAASVAGAAVLTNEQNAVVVDIGGTTCDLALIRDGVPVRTADGVSLGPWQTTVCATYVDTFGLGGDSRVSVTDNILNLGPERVQPLCVLADEHPEIIGELERMNASRYQGQSRRYEFFKLLRSPKNGSHIDTREREICRLLEKGPMAVDALAEAIGQDIYTFRAHNLEKYGYIIRSGFTPTDAMHLAGIFSKYNSKASALGAGYFCRLLSINEDELCGLVFEKARLMLYTGIIRMLLRDSCGAEYADSADIARLAEKSFMGGTDFIQTAFTTSSVLVGIGAPTHVFIDEVAKNLGTRSAVPVSASVANAVGAAVSGIRVTHEVEIRPSYTIGGLEGYYVLSLEDNPFYDSYEEALSRAKAEAESSARMEAARRGLTGEAEVKIDVMRNDSIASLEDGIISIELGIFVRATVHGRIDR